MNKFKLEFGTGDRKLGSSPSSASVLQALVDDDGASRNLLDRLVLKGLGFRGFRV